MRNALLLAILRIVALLPLSIARGLGATIGYCAWRMQSSEAKVTRINLRDCYPEMTVKQLDHMVQERMLEWGKSLLELPVVWARSPLWIEKRLLKIHNQGLMQRLLDEGKGGIIIAPHLGNWEVVGLHASRYATLTSMFAPSGVEKLDNWIKSSRERAGAKLVPANNRGVIQLLKALKANQLLGILPDQVPSIGSGEFAPFFNRPALTMTLVHNLLKRSGAKAVFCYAKRVKGGFEVVFEAPPKELYSEDMQESLTALNKGVENAIAGAVPQYQWEYKRYRKRPPGTEKLYTRENSK